MNPAAGPGAGAAAGAQERPDGPATEHTAAAEAGFPAVSTSEARALIELLSARGIAQGQLAALLGLEKSTVSRLAAGLERKGWLRRGRDEGNQRFVRLYLTPEGRVIAARVWQAWQSRQARIVAGLSAEGLLEDAGAPPGPPATPDLPGPPATPDLPGPPGAPGPPGTRRYTQT